MLAFGGFNALMPSDADVRVVCDATAMQLRCNWLYARLNMSEYRPKDLLCSINRTHIRIHIRIRIYTHIRIQTRIYTHIQIRIRIYKLCVCLYVAAIVFHNRIHNRIHKPAD